MTGKQILVCNRGSSSFKLSLFSANGSIHRLLDLHLSGLETATPKLEITISQKSTPLPIPTVEGFDAVMPRVIQLLEADYGLVQESLLAIGHRYVHGGSKYRATTFVNDAVIEDLKTLSPLAPLHNELCLQTILWCRDYFGASLPQLALFDTAFHSTIPPQAAYYAIPNELAEKYKIKRYGFHGISHAFLWHTYRQKGPAQDSDKIITLHLGNGCSACAIKGGISYDTSMGFTPAEGLVMVTRAGDVDAAIIPFLCEHEGLTADAVLKLLNSQSGLKGVSGLAADMKSLVEQAPQNDRAKLAVAMFCYRVNKYVGAYMGALQGCKAIVFSGGIGENAPMIRSQIAKAWQWYGISLDAEANAAARGLPLGSLRCISQEGSTVAMYVVATDENGFIAKAVWDYCSRE